MIKYNIVVCRYDKILVNVAAYVTRGQVCVCVVRSTQEPEVSVYTTHTQTPNQELHMRPHLPRLYHSNTLLYCILSF
jgi:hypothetical protein